MRFKKRRRDRKAARFIAACHGLREPFKVLCDGSFDQHLASQELGSPGDVLRGFFYARVLPFTTRCINAELKRERLVGGWELAQQLPVARCEHDPVASVTTCIESLVEEDGKTEHFFVATQDPDLRKKLKKAPGVPTIYGLRKALFVEPPSVKQLEFVKSAELEQLHMSDTVCQKSQKVESRLASHTPEFPAEQQSGSEAALAQTIVKQDNARIALGITHKSQFKRKRPKEISDSTSNQEEVYSVAYPITPKKLKVERDTEQVNGLKFNEALQHFGITNAALFSTARSKNKLYALSTNHFYCENRVDRTIDSRDRDACSAVEELVSLFTAQGWDIDTVFGQETEINCGLAATILACATYNQNRKVIISKIGEHTIEISAEFIGEFLGIPVDGNVRFCHTERVRNFTWKGTKTTSARIQWDFIAPDQEFPNNNDFSPMTLVQKLLMPFIFSHIHIGQRRHMNGPQVGIMYALLTREKINLPDYIFTQLITFVAKKSTGRQNWKFGALLTKIGHAHLPEAFTTENFGNCLKQKQEILSFQKKYNRFHNLKLNRAHQQTEDIIEDPLPKKKGKTITKESTAQPETSHTPHEEPTVTNIEAPSLHTADIAPTSQPEPMDHHTNLPDPDPDLIDTTLDTDEIAPTTSRHEISTEDFASASLRTARIIEELRSGQLNKTQLMQIMEVGLQSLKNIAS